MSREEKRLPAEVELVLLCLLMPSQDMLKGVAHEISPLPKTKSIAELIKFVCCL